jgi:hypothetical protein
MKVHHPSKSGQLPDLFDWNSEMERRPVDHRTRWVARRCRVSLATAATLVAIAGFSNREGH